jgi:hypothetical protein
MLECNDDALEAAGSHRGELFGNLQQAGYNLFHLASFDGDHPFAVACDEKFPSREFNFAAIPSEPASLERWRSSVEEMGKQ